MATIASLATDAAKTAHAHVAQLLASRQVKPGDKLPLTQTVKETDPANSFSLAPTGKNIFVRVPSSSPSPCIIQKMDYVCVTGLTSSFSTI